MKKIISMILCLALCVSVFAACGTKAPTTTPNAGASSAPAKNVEYYDELSLYIIDKVAVIDVFNPGAQTSSSGIYSHMLYDTLVYYNRRQ